MDARSAKRNGIPQGHHLKTDPRTKDAGAERIASVGPERVQLAASSLASRPSIEYLFRSIVREELRPFAAMIHAVVGRLGRAAMTRDDFLSVAEAASVAHVGESTIRAWIKEGRLRAGKAGRLVRIRRADLNALITEPRDEKQHDPETEAAKILERNRPTER